MRNSTAVCLVVAFAAITPLVALAAPITVPTGLNPGDQYRLAFITSTTRFATSADIADYNAFVTTVANTVPELVALGTTWTSIISTTTVDARDNTASNPLLSVGVPIYNLANEEIATSNADFWDGMPSAVLSYSETGDELVLLVWTGSYYDGQRYPGLSAGDPSCRIGHPGQLHPNWMQLSWGLSDNFLHLYGISDVLTVVPEPGTMALAVFAAAGLTVRLSFRRRRHGNP